MRTLTTCVLLRKTRNTYNCFHFSDPPATVGTPTVSPGIELIQEEIEAGNHLIASGTLQDAPHHTWQTKTGAYLQKTLAPLLRKLENFASSADSVVLRKKIGCHGFGKSRKGFVA